MSIPSPIIDYARIREVTEPPFTWIAHSRGSMQQAARYEFECKTTNQIPSQERLLGLLEGNPVHLRIHTLENGLRYITVHREDGNQSGDYAEYRGAYFCKHDGKACFHVNSSLPKDVKGMNLGDGFLLNDINIHQEGTSITATKGFMVGSDSVKAFYWVYDKPFFFHIDYTTNPIEREVTETHGIGGAVMFSGRDIFRHDTPKQGTLIMKVFYDQAGENPVTSLSTQYVIPNPRGDIKSNSAFFAWNREGKLERIADGDNRFQVDGHTAEAAILSDAVFGRDISRLTLDARLTLNKIVRAAIENRFVSPELLLCLQ